MIHFGETKSFLRKHRQVCFSPPFRLSNRATMANKRQASQKPTIAQKKLSNVFLAKENFWSFSSFGSPASLSPHRTATNPSHFHSRNSRRNMHKHDGSCSIEISILILETKASYTWHFSAETNVGVECAKRRQINRKQNCFTALFLFSFAFVVALQRTKPVTP